MLGPAAGGLTAGAGYSLFPNPLSGVIVGIDPPGFR